MTKLVSLSCLAAGGAGRVAGAAGVVGACVAGAACGSASVARAGILSVSAVEGGDL